MPAAKTPATRDYPVRDHFRRKERNPKTGLDVSVSYDPAGDDVDNGGWPGAKAVFTGTADEARVLLDAGLLFPIPEDPSTSSKEN